MKVLPYAMCLALFLGIGEVRAQSRAEESIYNELTADGPEKARVGALDRVLKDSADYSTGILYAASGVAFQQKRIEDAGFLFHIAQLRAFHDKIMFPPKGTGGNNPMLAIGAMNQVLGEQINPAVSADAKVYAGVVARVKAWKPGATAKYEPGWEYTRRVSEKEVLDAFAPKRKDNIDHMSAYATLLQDAKFFAAHKTMQDYNLKFGSKDRPTEADYKSALQTTGQIAREKGFSDIAEIFERQLKALDKAPSKMEAAPKK